MNFFLPSIHASACSRVSCLSFMRRFTPQRFPGGGSSSKSCGPCSGPCSGPCCCPCCPCCYPCCGAACCCCSYCCCAACIAGVTVGSGGATAMVTLPPPRIASAATGSGPVGGSCATGGLGAPSTALGAVPPSVTCSPPRSAASPCACSTWREAAFAIMRSLKAASALSLVRTPVSRASAAASWRTTRSGCCSTFRMSAGERSDESWSACAPCALSSLSPSSWMPRHVIGSSLVSRRT
mmetsp:Transcript_46292/g.92402  ORF Transcript_46292/g.92402 Transcript_46292/m.92402 type:complete len:238 (+) Transcript_46292:249-962(+)